jgi:hypothetical protein
LKRRAFLALSAAILPVTAIAQPKTAKLIVHVEYMGPGTWDKSHRMACAIWPSPDFMTKSKSMKALSHTLVDYEAKAAIFDNITADVVYVSFALDVTGNWDGIREPPAGALFGKYGFTPGAPTAVQLKLGKTTTIMASWGKQTEKII